MAERVEHDRRQHETHAQLVYGGPAQHGRQCHGPRGRVQTAQRQHEADGNTNGNTGGHDNILNGSPAGDAHHCCHKIAANDGPGLGERAGGHGKKQDGRCPHRRNQPGQAAVISQHGVTDRCRDQNTQQGAHAGADALFRIAAQCRWHKIAQERAQTLAERRCRLGKMLVGIHGRAALNERAVYPGRPACWRAMQSLQRALT